MSNIVQFNGVTTQKQDADEILEANKGHFDEVVFMGFDNEGQFSAGANFSDVGKMLLLIELLKRQLMDELA